MILHLRQAYFQPQDPSGTARSTNISFALQHDLRQKLPRASRLVDPSFYVHSEVDAGEVGNFVA